MKLETQYIETPPAITNFSLEDTVTSGQTFCWLVAPTEADTTAPLSNPSTDTFYLPTVLNDTPIVYAVTQEQNNQLKYTVYGKSNPFSSNKLTQYFQKRLGFNRQYDTALSRLQSRDSHLYQNSRLSLSLILDEPFEASISFICSPQASIDRIYQMQRNLEQNYGTPIDTPEGKFYTFPTPEQLTSATEDDLRELNLGYRASYVTKTVTKITTGEVELPRQTTDLPTSELTDELQDLVGVGTKVADCIALYGYGRMEVIPVDTRIEQMVTEYYDDSVSTPPQAKATLTDMWPAEYAGYYQLLLYEFASDKL